MIFGPSWTNQCAAGYYRLRAIIPLVATNVATLLIAFVGPHFRFGRGVSSGRDIVATVLTVLVSFIFPCLPVFGLYWARWPSLRDERIHGWQGRCMTWTVWVMCLLAVGSLIFVTMFAHYEVEIPPGHPLENNRPPEMSLEAQVLNWFTAVSVLLVFSLFFGLVPVDPYKRQDEIAET